MSASGGKAAAGRSAAGKPAAGKPAGGNPAAGRPRGSRPAGSANASARRSVKNKAVASSRRPQASEKTSPFPAMSDISEKVGPAKDALGKVVGKIGFAQGESSKREHAETARRTGPVRQANPGRQTQDTSVGQTAQKPASSRPERSQDVAPSLTVASPLTIGDRLGTAVGSFGAASKGKLAIIGAVILAYLLVALYFSMHFYPNSKIGNVQVGGMDAPAAAEALGKATSDYQLEVQGENGISFTVMSHEAGLSLDTSKLAEQALADNPGLGWPLMIFLPHDHSELIVASADAGGYRTKVSDAIGWYNQKAEAPENARIVYDSNENTFKIEPEKQGTMLDVEEITERVTAALAAMEPKLVLGEEDYKRPEVYADDERLQASLAKAQQVLNTNAVFQANGQDVATLDGKTAASWVRSDEQGELELDEDTLNVWVQDVYDKSSTVGNKRTWKREDGKQCTVEGGEYGWLADWLGIDEKVHEVIWSGYSGKVDIPMSQEADAYDGANGRDWKAYIDVDLDTQHAVFYDENGKAIWEADFVSGAPDGKHETPTGVYFINNMQSPSKLIGERNATGRPEYETTVQYWMAWRSSDIGFHDADWQPAYGGSLYQEGYGSHGCINLSPEDAAALYKLVDFGTVVVSHGGVTGTASSTASDTSASASNASSASGSDSSSEGSSNTEDSSNAPADTQDQFESESDTYADSADTYGYGDESYE